ncbi:MAG: CinA family protein [Methylococcaceae bacterium]|jgi:nicotinamide-nucleotide amidase|nr:CinA family protein [Methylococcaceae bacterium]MDZ4156407.1 CinA family protein [Methylococcales bacterium]MDP2394667.1 CinA family protein [Methylococcaceae bacterium]MDP3019135.1 CinA family protein [Methylococcaceae bacterium]MDP3390351.1 CinA family protein [Methylococcaceae bacterium]
MSDTLIGLAEQLGHFLKTNNQKIATAESCTGGWIAQCITEVPGCSTWFDRGFVTYSNAAKMQMLGVLPETLLVHGAVSAETALEMVTGALANSEADCAIAVTGIAGPDGGSTEKPVGTVYIAWQTKNQAAKIKKMFFTGSRQQIREQTVIAAIKGVLS